MLVADTAAPPSPLPLYGSTPDPCPMGASFRPGSTCRSPLKSLRLGERKASRTMALDSYPLRFVAAPLQDAFHAVSVFRACVDRGEARKRWPRHRGRHEGLDQIEVEGQRLVADNVRHQVKLAGWLFRHARPEYAESVSGLLQAPGSPIRLRRYQDRHFE